MKPMIKLVRGDPVVARSKFWCRFGTLFALSVIAVRGVVAAEVVPVSPPGMSSQSPDVAVSAEGAIHVVWIGENTAPPNAEQIAKRGHSHDSSTNLYLASSTDGGRSFSTPRQLNATSGDVWGFAISKPRIAVGGDGGVHVLYPGNTTNAKTGASETVALYVRSQDNAGERTFSSPRRLNVDALTDDLSKDDGGSFATLAIDDRNTVYAAWVDTRMITDSEMGRAALAVSSDGGRTFSADVEILPSIVCPCCQLSSAIDTQRHLVLGARLVDGAYRDNEIVVLSDQGRRIERRQRISGARWALEGCPRKPTALALRDQHWVAAYYSGAETPDGVYVVNSTDGGITWSTPKALHVGATLSDAPALVFAGPRVHAVWHARIADRGFRLFASHSDDGGAQFTPPVELPLPPGIARLPAVSAHADGSLQLVWQHERTIRTLRWRP